MNNSKITGVSYVGVSVTTLVAIALNQLSHTLPVSALINLFLIPVVLAAGYFVRNRIANIFLLFLHLYVLMSYLLPMIAIAVYPEYLQSIRTYNGTEESDINWTLMMLFDVIAIQSGVLLAGSGKAGYNIQINRINIGRGKFVGYTLIAIISIFNIFFDTGKYVEGEIVANPFAQLVQPYYIIIIMMIYPMLNTKDEPMNRPKDKGIFWLIAAYVVMTVLSGSRSGLVFIFFIYAASWLLLHNELNLKQIKFVTGFVLTALVLFVVATVIRGGGADDIGSIFYHSSNLGDAIVIYIIKRIGLHEDIYQISNGLYNMQIYSEIGFFQFFGSLFDLLMPGTYFPGVYSLSALNQVWLYNYDVTRIATDWSSIAVPLSAVNYLYFGKAFGFFFTVLVVFSYVRISIWLIAKSRNLVNIYFGMYMMGIFSLSILTSMGYEYLIRALVMGYAHLWFWLKIVIIRRI